MKTTRGGADTGFISKEVFEARLVELCLRSGMKGFPRRHRDQQILLKSVVLTLEPEVEYSERQIDDKLAFWLADIARSIQFDSVTLRRWLVDDGYLDRHRDGSAYWVSGAGPRDAEFDPEVGSVDTYRVIGAGMKEIERKKQQHLGRA